MGARVSDFFFIKNQNLKKGKKILFLISFFLGGGGGQGVGEGVDG